MIDITVVTQTISIADYDNTMIPIIMGVKRRSALKGLGLWFGRNRLTVVVRQ